MYAAQTKCGMHIIRIVIIKVGFKGAERKCRVLHYDYLIDEIWTLQVTFPQEKK